MTIAALPSQTVRAIGSTQALTDSASVVKELVDNALDAQATSIGIEISTNTLDVIQVKDNGHGIDPIDRPLACKRYCTSKIRDLEDLAKIGGASLGFRGEALASAVELSGAVTLTTRIMGEATAVNLKVSQNGEVANEDRVSHGVGTTVRINNFLKSIPVRQQTALKESAKQLAKIKRTLQVYALARPSVRLSLKILKAKNDKGNWLYAPKSDASVLDAAVKVFGKKLTDQCRWVVWSQIPRSVEAGGAPQGDNTMMCTHSDSSYRIEALIPDSDADPAAISSADQYISIDSRPVSSSRGTFKQIAQLFKLYIRSSCTSSTDQKITNPFLCMNLACPSGSYDANVEPAKDDVLFSDSPSVLEMVENFLKCQYGKLQTKNKQTVKSKSTAAEPRTFDLLLARKPPPASVHKLLSAPDGGEDMAYHGTSPTKLQELPARNREIMDQIGGIRHCVGETSSEISQSSPTRPLNNIDQHCRRDMYPDDYDDGPITTNGALQGQDAEEQRELRDVRVTNPWTFAKLNAPIRPQGPSESSADVVRNDQQLLTPFRQHGSLRGELSSPDFHPGPMMGPCLPTPAKSQNGNEVSSPDNFPYPIKRWGKIQRESNPRNKGRSPTEKDSSPTRLDTWVQRPPPQSDIRNQESLFLEDDVVPPKTRRDFVSAAELPQGTPLDAIPDISQAPRRKHGLRKQQHQISSHTINKPFKPPAVQDPTRVWFDHLDAPLMRPPKSKERRIDNSVATRPMNNTTAEDVESHPTVDEEPPQRQYQHPGLALTMDYEARKAAATAQRRALLRQQTSSHRSPKQHFLDPPSEQSTPIKIGPSQQSILPSSPHQNRYKSAIAALHAPLYGTTKLNLNGALSPSADRTTAFLSENTDNMGQEGVVRKMDPKDPRAYLIRSLTPNDGRFRRSKISLLPLESLSSTSNGDGNVRDLTHVIDTSELLSQLAKQIKEHDEEEENIHSLTPDLSAFENINTEEAMAWEETITNLIFQTFPECDNNLERVDLGLDLIATFNEYPKGP
ncbi:MAG: hypothetical protein Q9209_007861 [Squamulea sp. 1 TL-2023]